MLETNLHLVIARAADCTPDRWHGSSNHFVGNLMIHRRKQVVPSSNLLQQTPAIFDRIRIALTESALHRNRRVVQHHCFTFGTQIVYTAIATESTLVFVTLQRTILASGEASYRSQWYSWFYVFFEQLLDSWWWVLPGSTMFVHVRVLLAILSLTTRTKQPLIVMSSLLRSFTSTSKPVYFR